jgi:hypothetical protein
LDIATLLPPRLLTQLRVVLGKRHTLHAASSWEDLLDALRMRAIDLAIVDPCADGHIAVEGVLHVRQHFPSLRMIIYTAVRPESLYASVELARHGAGQLVLFRYDDSRNKFLSVIEEQPGTELATAVLTALAPALIRLPVSHAGAIEDLFKHPGRYRTAQDLSRASGLGLRRLYRLHHGVGLASPWAVVSHARMLHAYAQLRDGGHLLADIEARLGYSQGRMRALMHKLYRAPPVKIRKLYKPEAFVARLLAQVFPGASASLPHESSRKRK